MMQPIIILSIMKQKISICNEARVDEGYVTCNEQKKIVQKK